MRITFFKGQQLPTPASLQYCSDKDETQTSFGMRSENILQRSKRIFYFPSQLPKMRLNHKKQIQSLRDYVFSPLLNKKTLLQKNDQSANRNLCKSVDKKYKDKAKRQIEHKTTIKKINQSKDISTQGTMSEKTANDFINKQGNMPYLSSKQLEKNGKKDRKWQESQKTHYKGVNNPSNDKMGLEQFLSKDQSILIMSNDMSFSESYQETDQQQFICDQISDQNVTIMEQLFFPDQTFKKIKISQYLKNQQAFFQ